MKLWLWISVLMAFAAGTAVGILAAGRLWTPQKAAVGPIFPQNPDVLIYPWTSEEIHKELGLKDEQQRRIDALVAEHYRRARDLGQQMGNLVHDLQAGITAVLTAEQIQRFEEIQKRYAEREIQTRVTREIARMREEVKVLPEQEPRVYTILFDAERSRRELFRKFFPLKRDDSESHKKFREELAGISTIQDSQIKNVLSSTQFDAYQKLKERERSFFKKGGDRRDRGERGDRGDRSGDRGERGERGDPGEKDAKEIKDGGNAKDAREGQPGDC